MGARLDRWVPVAAFAVVAIGAVIGSTITAPSTFGPVIEAPFVFVVVAVPLAFWLLAAGPSRDRARSRPELVVLCVLPVLFGGLFAWSQLRPGSTPPCFNLGAHGRCHDVKVMSSTDGSTRDQLVDRVIANYRASGWPLVASRNGESYEACRPVAGILLWGDHCMRVVVKEGSDGYIGAPDVKGAVNVYIDAAQGIDAV